MQHLRGACGQLAQYPGVSSSAWCNQHQCSVDLCSVHCTAWACAVHGSRAHPRAAVQRRSGPGAPCAEREPSPHPCRSRLTPIPSPPFLPIPRPRCSPFPQSGRRGSGQPRLLRTALSSPGRARGSGGLGHPRLGSGEAAGLGALRDGAEVPLGSSSAPSPCKRGAGGTQGKRRRCEPQAPRTPPPPPRSPRGLRASSPAHWLHGGGAAALYKGRVGRLQKGLKKPQTTNPKPQTPTAPTPNPTAASATGAALPAARRARPAGSASRPAMERC